MQRRGLRKLNKRRPRMYQTAGQWTPTDPNTPFTYEDLYGENWETVTNDLKAGEQKVYPWQGSSLRNQTSTGKDPMYWNEDGTFKTADQLIMSTNKRFANFKPNRKTENSTDLNIALQNSNRILKPKEKVPFSTEEEGNTFREYINTTYPEYAKKINLDKTGSFDNTYIQKAWDKYGQAFTDSDVSQQTNEEFYQMYLASLDEDVPNEVIPSFNLTNMNSCTDCHKFVGLTSRYIPNQSEKDQMSMMGFNYDAYKEGDWDKKIAALSLLPAALFSGGTALGGVSAVSSTIAATPVVAPWVGALSADLLMVEGLTINNLLAGAFFVDGANSLKNKLQDKGYNLEDAITDPSTYMEILQMFPLTSLGTHKFLLEV